MACIAAKAGKARPPDAIPESSKEYATVVVNVEWPMLAGKQSSSQAQRLSIQLRALVQAQQPTTPAAVTRFQQALNQATTLGEVRQARIDMAKDRISVLLTVGILLGGVITVGFAFVFGMKSSKVHAFVMFSLTLLTCFMLLITYEFSFPFAGVANVGSENFQMALHYMQALGAPQGHP